jgi:serine/threonine-protein kinase
VKEALGKLPTGRENHEGDLRARVARYRARTGPRFLVAALATAVVGGCAVAGFVVAILAFTGNSEHPRLGGLLCLVILALTPGTLAVVAARSLERRYGYRGVLLRVLARGDHAALLSAPSLAARAGIPLADAIEVLAEAQRNQLAPPTVPRTPSGNLAALGPASPLATAVSGDAPTVPANRDDTPAPATAWLPRPSPLGIQVPSPEGGFGGTVPMARPPIPPPAGLPARAPAANEAPPRTVRLPAALLRHNPPEAAIQALDHWVGRTLHETWTVEAPVGRGGMGAVFRARHRRTGRYYALKVLLPGTSDDPADEARALARFEREATAASRLGHPGIVQVHDFHRTPDGGAYLVMDLLVGETLAARLARAKRGGQIPFSEVRRIAGEVGEALTAAHAHGLVHRDVKPANIFLVAAPPRTVLVDFGLVKPPSDAAISVHTTSGEVLGTPLYMAPEQAKGGAVDARTDLYGLAMVVYEAVVGLPPCFEADLAAAYTKLLSEEAPPASVAAPEGCPPGFDAVIGRALAAKPEDRFPTVAAFVQALNAL